MRVFTRLCRNLLSKKFVPIKSKLLLSLTFSIFIFGIAAMIATYLLVSRTVRNEMLRNAEIKIDILQSKVFDRMIVRDYAALNHMLQLYKQKDPWTVYVVVRDKNNEIIGHTFSSNQVPVFLLNDTPGLEQRLFRDQKTGLKIRQFCTVLGNNNDGMLQVGLNDSLPFKQGWIFAGLIAVFVSILLGPVILISYFFSFTITTPIHKMVGRFESFHPDTPLEKPVDTICNDEIRLLANGFNAMAGRIHELTKEKNETNLKIIETEKLASIGVLSSGIAHEINNPATSIEVCALRLSKKGALNEQQEKYVNLILDSIRHVQLVVKNLLHYARTPDDGNEIVDLAPVVDMGFQIMEHRLDKFHIPYSFRKDSQSNFVRGQRANLVQIVINGISNAIDAVGENGKIDIVLQSDNDWITLRIQDNGSGISPEISSKVFDPFFTTKGQEGTGLGLYSCYTIVKTYNGEISLENREDEGAELLIKLPKVEDS